MEWILNMRIITRKRDREITEITESKMKFLALMIWKESGVELPPPFSRFKEIIRDIMLSDDCMSGY